MLSRQAVLSSLLAFTLFQAYTFAAPLNAESILEHLSSSALGLSPATKIYLEWDPDFKNETARWTTHDPPKYVAAVQPAVAADVQKIVRSSCLLQCRYAQRKQTLTKWGHSRSSLPPDLESRFLRLGAAMASPQRLQDSRTASTSTWLASTASLSTSLRRP